jgi:hypothetical protein
MQAGHGNQADALLGSDLFDKYAVAIIAKMTASPEQTLTGS